MNEENSGKLNESRWTNVSMQWFFSISLLVMIHSIKRSDKWEESRRGDIGVSTERASKRQENGKQTKTRASLHTRTIESDQSLALLISSDIQKVYHWLYIGWHHEEGCQRQ
jgi:hypothetical protein